MRPRILKNPVILSDAEHREGSPLGILRPGMAQNDANHVFSSLLEEFLQRAKQTRAKTRCLQG